MELISLYAVNGVTAEEREKINNIKTENDYELIEEITLSAGIAALERTTESDGRAYDFKNIFVSVIIPATVTFTDDLVCQITEDGEDTYAIALAYASPLYKQCSFFTELKNNFRLAVASDISPTYAPLRTYANSHRLLSNVGISKIRLSSYSSLKAGMIIKIYGQRK